MVNLQSAGIFLCRHECIQSKRKLHQIRKNPTNLMQLAFMDFSFSECYRGKSKMDALLSTEPFIRLLVIQYQRHILAIATHNDDFCIWRCSDFLIGLDHFILQLLVAQA